MEISQLVENSSWPNFSVQFFNETERSDIELFYKDDSYFLAIPCLASAASLRTLSSVF